MAGKVLTGLGRGFAGQESRSIDNVKESFVNEGTTAIKFGMPVVLGGTKGGVKNFVPGTSTANDFVGVAVRIAKTENTYAADDACYNVNEIVDVMLRGQMTVKVVGATAPVVGGTVYVDATTGNFTAVATSNTALTNVVFKTAADGNGIAEIAITKRAL